MAKATTPAPPNSAAAKAARAQRQPRYHTLGRFAAAPTVRAAPVPKPAAPPTLPPDRARHRQGHRQASHQVSTQQVRRPDGRHIVLYVTDGVPQHHDAPGLGLTTVGDVAHPDPEAAARYMRERLARDMAAPSYAACHCLCGRAHPARPGICQADDATVTRTITTELLGAVIIPLCEPCADAWPA